MYVSMFVYVNVCRVCSKSFAHRVHRGKGCPPGKASIRAKLAYHASIRAKHVVEWNLVSYFLEIPRKYDIKSIFDKTYS